jgi:integrase
MATVRFQNVQIEILPWRHPSGRDYHRFTYTHAGARRSVTRSTLKAAKDAALNVAIDLARGTIDLKALPDPTLRKLQRILEVDPRLERAAQVIETLERTAPRMTVDQARKEFLAAKEGAAGASPHHLRTLTRHLALLPGGLWLDEVGSPDLLVRSGAARTRRNILFSWRAFFRWCVRRGLLPPGDTVADRLEIPIVTRSTPDTYTPAELRILFEHVSPAYRSFLGLAAWGGLRTEEICPDYQSKKPPLAWEDISWDRRLIIVRPETSKTGHRRVIPLCDALHDLLLPLRGTGRIGPALPPHRPRCGGELAETTRLGSFIGGWRRNALRHSFLSFRAAIAGISQAALESGNSETVARRNYNDAKGADEAAEWFNVLKCSHPAENAVPQGAAGASTIP